MPLKYANKKKNYWNWTEFAKNAVQRNCYNNFYWNILSSHRHAFAFSLRVFNCFFFPSFLFFWFYKAKSKLSLSFLVSIKLLFHRSHNFYNLSFFLKSLPLNFARKQSQLPVASLNWENNSLSLLERKSLIALFLQNKIWHQLSSSRRTCWAWNDFRLQFEIHHGWRMLTDWLFSTPYLKSYYYLFLLYWYLPLSYWHNWNKRESLKSE